MFFAHDIAAWLGIPAGIVIACLFVLRKRGKEFQQKRRQQR
jgi:hypothetical protein